jgi:hypothetical protein
MAIHEAHVWRKTRNTYKFVVGIPEGRSARGCEDNIKLHLKEIGLDFVGWNQLAWVRVQWESLMNRAMNFPVA